MVGDDDAVEQGEATFCGDDVLRRVFPRTDDIDSGERNPRDEGRDTIKTAMPKSALILDSAMENEVELPLPQVDTITDVGLSLAFTPFDVRGRNNW